MTVFTPRRFERRSHREPDTKSCTTARAELFTTEPELFIAPSPLGHEQLG
jgi:hypothetical protein